MHEYEQLPSRNLRHRATRYVKCASQTHAAVLLRSEGTTRTTVVLGGPHELVGDQAVSKVE